MTIQGKVFCTDCDNDKFYIYNDTVGEIVIKCCNCLRTLGNTKSESIDDPLSESGDDDSYTDDSL